MEDKAKQLRELVKKLNGEYNQARKELKNQKNKGHHTLKGVVCKALCF